MSSPLSLQQLCKTFSIKLVHANPRLLRSLPAVLADELVDLSFTVSQVLQNPQSVSDVPFLQRLKIVVQSASYLKQAGRTLIHLCKRKKLTEEQIRAKFVYPELIQLPRKFLELSGCETAFERRSCSSLFLERLTLDMLEAMMSNCSNDL